MYKSLIDIINLKVGGNMKNFEHIKYTYKHRKIVMLLAEKYFKDNGGSCEKTNE